jgi:hypothetical protein
MKRLYILLIFSVNCFLYASINPIIVPKAFISELYFNNEGKWFLEITFNFPFNPDSYEKLRLVTATGSSDVRMDNIPKGTILLILTSDSLDLPVNIIREGDHVEIHSFLTEYEFRQIDELCFGFYPPENCFCLDCKKKIPTPQNGYSISRKTRGYAFPTMLEDFYSNTIPTLGEFNDKTINTRLNFAKEDITFTFESEHFVVEGNYFFRNNTDQFIRRNILYPFPQENQFGKVDSVYLIDLTTQKKLRYEKSKNSISFSLETPSKDSTLIFIYYKQKIISDSVKYILTTTRFWGRPFEYVEYKLIVDPSLEITKFSYEPDKEYLIDGKKIYYWGKENFMPDRDMVFHFKRK